MTLIELCPTILLVILIILPVAGKPTPRKRSDLHARDRYEATAECEKIFKSKVLQ